MDMARRYVIHRARSGPALSAAWNSDAWSPAAVAEVSHFLPQSSAHHPPVFARLLHDDDGIHGIFLVRDRYVRCTRTHYFDNVWKDSCVEFFVRPRADGGYFNFEFNCGGAFLCNYITDWSKDPRGWKEFVPLSPALGQQVKVKSSLPAKVDPEIAEPVEWTLQFFIPYTVMGAFIGIPKPEPGGVWRGNFFKCAEEVSHPHWAAWSPVDEFNFHLPQCFGDLEFAE